MFVELIAPLLALMMMLDVVENSPVQLQRQQRADDDVVRLLDRLEQLADNLDIDQQESPARYEHRHDDVIDRRSFDDVIAESGLLMEESRISTRATLAFTADQQKQLIDAHNKYRRTVGASDMELVKWNAKLSTLAQLWSDKCAYNHGHVPFNGDAIGFNEVGQNNWAGTDAAVDVNKIVDDWYKEKDSYNYGSAQCAGGRTCDRYTQLVWSSTTDVGCAMTRCPSVAGLSNALFVVCYYGPPGNWLGEKPYKTGAPACSQCVRGQFYCNNGLCDSSCTSAGSNCECKAACKNCATQTGDCKCQCKDGSTGVDCSLPCDNFDKRCDTLNGWSANLCRQPFQFVIDHCPKMCGKCRPGKPCGRNEEVEDMIVQMYGEQDQV